MPKQLKLAFAIFTLILAVFANISLVSAATSVTSAGSGGGGTPSGFCDHSYYHTIAWVVSAGTPKMSKPCSNAGAFIMDLNGKEFGHKTPWSWNKLENKRAGRAATYYFDALPSKPSGFCTVAPPNNPGWHMPTGVRFSSAPCSGPGKWAMSLKNVVYRFNSYKALVAFWCTKHYYEMTLYFERSPGGCGCG